MYAQPRTAHTLDYITFWAKKKGGLPPPKLHNTQSHPLHSFRCAIISSKVSNAKPLVVSKVGCVAVCGGRP